MLFHEIFNHLRVDEPHQADPLLRPSGVPEKPEIDGLTKPAIEGDHITLTCMTQGSKPAADLRWFRNEKEVKGETQQPSQLEFSLKKKQKKNVCSCQTNRCL